MGLALTITNHDHHMVINGSGALFGVYTWERHRLYRISGVWVWHLGKGGLFRLYFLFL